MNKFFFSVGPSQIHPKVEFHSQQFYEQQLGSVSHRSEIFRNIYRNTVDELRLLMNIPDDFAILFLSSASEIFERILLNCVREKSFHLVNGAFADKIYQFAVALDKKPYNLEKQWGSGFELNEVVVPDDAELICVTQNETSTGVAIPEEMIAAIKAKYPNKLIAVDIVSSAPYPKLDFTKLDMAFFSVQKAFGLPAGLGVWLIKNDCIEQLKNKQSVGAQNTLSSLFKNYQNFETTSTPNIYNIYLLNKIAEEFNKTGIQQIRKETDERAKLLYDFFEQSNAFSLAVTEKKFQSKTVVVANCLHQPSAQIINQLKEKGLVIGSGYGKMKDAQIRIANFPAITKSKVEELIAAIATIK